MKNILFVSHSDFPTNSSVHVHHFANELIKLGLDCVVAVPHDKSSISTLKDNLYKVTQFDEIDRLPSLFNNQQNPDIVHCWTPREHIRLYCLALSTQYDFKLVIHFEDNEESIIERYLKLPLAKITSENDHLIPYNLSHPQKYQNFLSTADGATIIIEELNKFIPPQLPLITLYPGVNQNQFFPQPRDIQLAESLGITDENTTILCYTGNIHLANLEEVRCLYLAVGLRNLVGKPTVLIRTGIDNNCQYLSEDENWIKKHIIELGWVDREQIPAILALADVLIQPGKSDDFNDYRFPSKIPEFLAMGKPVILPATNIGKIMTNYENALILPSVDEISLQEAIDLIVNDKELSKKLSQEGVKFATNYLDWAKNAKLLMSFYETLFNQDKQLTSITNALTRVKTHAQELENKSNQTLTTLITTETHLQKTHIKIEELKKLNFILQEEIEAMKTSKFWQIRSQWFKLKNRIGLKQK